MQFVCASMKLRQIFYTQIELRTFHTVWTQRRQISIFIFYHEQAIPSSGLRYSAAKFLRRHAVQSVFCGV
jgi:hypothetical protein